MMTRTARRTTRERRSRVSHSPNCPAAAGSGAGSILPAIAEAGVVLNQIEVRIDVAELLADALDQGADIGPVALLARTGAEPLAPDEVVDLAIGDVAPGPRGEQPR